MGFTNKFEWPQQHRSHPPNTNVIVTTVKNLITSMINNDTQIQIENTTDIQQSTEKPIIFISTLANSNSSIAVTEQSTESLTENITTIVSDTVSSTMKSIATEMATNMGIPSGNMTGTNFNLDESVGSNSTFVTDEIGNNSTIMENNRTIIDILETTDSSLVIQTIQSTVENNQTIINAMLTTESNVVTETIKNTLEPVATTTEKVIDIVSNTTFNILKNGTTLIRHHEHNLNEDNSMTVIIILGVLLGILILIVIGLFVFYKKYKKCHTSTGYAVTQLKEISNSSIKSENLDSENFQVKL